MKKNFLIKKLYQLLFLIFIFYSSNLKVEACSFTFAITLSTGEKNYSCKFLDNTAGPAQTCAQLNKSESTNLEPGASFFCSSTSEIVKCPSSLLNSNYDRIFQPSYSNVTGTFEYTSLNGGIGCSYYNPRIIPPATGCQNKSNPTNANCNFGNPVTNSGTQNCAENTSEGEYDLNGKKVYCAPNGQKVHCDSSISYNDLFGPVQTFNNATGRYDYNFTGKFLQSSAVTSKNCKVGLPTINIISGCNVSSSSKPGDDCAIPSDCYSSSSQPIVSNLISRGGTGGLYCISKSDITPKEGRVYFCPNQVVNWPSVNRTYRYDEISELKTVSGGQGVFLKKDAAKNCRTILNVNAEYRELDPLSPLGLIRSASTFLYYFAIFYFIVLMLTNAFAYVRSGEDPAALKKIKESLFNTIAGFLFVLLSGGVIVYLINQISL